MKIQLILLYFMISSFMNKFESLFTDVLCICSELFNFNCTTDLKSCEWEEILEYMILKTKQRPRTTSTRKFQRTPIKNSFPSSSFYD